MTSTFFSSFWALAGSSVSMVLLLVKATLILLVALGITLSMQRASAGARHLVWLVTLAALLLVPALTAWAPIPIRVLPAAVPPAAVMGFHPANVSKSTPRGIDETVPIVIGSVGKGIGTVPAPSLRE